MSALFPGIDPRTVQKRFFSASPMAMWVAVVIIFMIGIGIRLYQFSDPPLEFHAERQLHSMLIARGIYYELTGATDDWHRTRAIEQYHEEGLIEPQITETITALLYRASGRVDLRIPRLLTILFWSLGALGLFLLAKDLTDANGGVIALGFYMTTAFGVMVSRAFMPETLLITAIIWAWWSMLHWKKTQGWKQAILAGVLSGFAILVKSTAVFFIAGAWIGFVLGGLGLRKALTSRQVWLIAALAILPYAVYHVYAVYISGEMTSQFSLRFFPELWKNPASYIEWYKMIRTVVRFEWLVLAVVGLLLLREKFSRWLFFGAMLGYFIYAMLFIYYSTTHDYYHLPLLPLVAIGLGSAFSLLVAHFNLGRIGSAVAFASVLIIPWVVNLADAVMELRSRDYFQDAALAEQASSLFKPEDKVVCIAPYYGLPLRYWGWMDPTNWMSGQDIYLRQLAGQEFDSTELFKETTAGMDYFLVMNFDEFENQPEVKNYLENGYEVKATTADYIVFDLNRAISR